MSRHICATQSAMPRPPKKFEHTPFTITCQFCDIESDKVFTVPFHGFVPYPKKADLVVNPNLQLRTDKAEINTLLNGVHSDVIKQGKDSFIRHLKRCHPDKGENELKKVARSLLPNHKRPDLKHLSELDRKQHDQAKNRKSQAKHRLQVQQQKTELECLKSAQELLDTYIPDFDAIDPDIRVGLLAPAFMSTRLVFGSDV